VADDTDGDGCTARDEHLVRVGFALGGDDGCIADARQHAAAFLDQAGEEYGLLVTARARDLAQLVVSELVTNACKYAPGPVLVELGLTAGAVEVVVWDSDPEVPAVRAADPGRIGGHGLEIVKAVSEGLSVDREAVGKRITARIALTEPSGASASEPAMTTAPPGRIHQDLRPPRTGHDPAASPRPATMPLDDAPQRGLPGGAPAGEAS
jgi:anti-sigma regulatory factor (Ser/Thr protein kinase)